MCSGSSGATNITHTLLRRLALVVVWIDSLVGWCCWWSFLRFSQQLHVCTFWFVSEQERATLIECIHSFTL